MQFLVWPVHRTFARQLDLDLWNQIALRMIIIISPGASVER